MKRTLILAIGSLGIAGALVLLVKEAGGAQPSKAGEKKPIKVSAESAADLKELLTQPSSYEPAEQAWASFVESPQWKGPGLTQADGGTMEVRPVTPLERYMLGQVMDPRAVDAVRIYNGVRPDWIKADAQIPPQLHGITNMATRDGRSVPEIWFPSPMPRWWRWNLGVLAHEAAHAQQALMGLTGEESARAFERYGYLESPVEVQARWMQRKMLDHIDSMVSGAT